MNALGSFRFAQVIERFDDHIRASIPGYVDLVSMCVELSARFVQAQTRVIDVGCTTGRVLRRLRIETRKRRDGVQYVGLELEPQFQRHWPKRKEDLSFVIADARSFDFTNSSVVLSLFTLQFLAPRDRLPLLRRIRDGLLPGGALIVAEKVLAGSSQVQEILATLYHQYKRKHFTAEEILDKEAGLVGQMVCSSEGELFQELRDAGFRDVQPVWRQYQFVGLVASA